MTRTYKFKVPVGGMVPINIQRDARIVHIDIQGRDVHFWAIIDDDYPLVIRRFIVLGTGWEIPARYKHIGTAQSRDEFVWHLFEFI